MALKLLLFAACERVIVGEDDHLTSVIAIVERITAQVLQELPKEAALPFKWTVVALWRRPEDLSEAEEYEQRVDIQRPDGEVAGGGKIKFTVTREHSNFRNVMNVPAVPIGLEGICKLRLYLRRVNENDWTEIAEYPFEVRHQRVNPDEAAQP